MRIYINGIGVTGGFGTGAKDLVASLENGAAPVRPSDTGYGRAFLADASPLDAFVPKKSLRRIDHFSQMAILGAHLALQDAGTSLAGRRTGLIVCSGYGASRTTFSFLDSVINDGDTCASPTFFSNSVHNSAVGHISILLKLDGPCMTVSQFEMSVHSGLLSACQWLQEGRVDQVLFGAVDEHCDVVGYCYGRFFGEDNKGEMSPMAPGIQSAIPGEGAAFFLLSKGKRDSSRYGAIVDVQAGRLNTDGIPHPGDALFIIGADGHRRCDRLYADLLHRGAEAACYSPLYGSLPAGPAFDMAIAALSIREKRIFASPATVAEQGSFKIIKNDLIIDKRPISCLKLGKEGEVGMITLTIS